MYGLVKLTNFIVEPTIFSFTVHVVRLSHKSWFFANFIQFCESVVRYSSYLLYISAIAEPAPIFLTKNAGHAADDEVITSSIYRYRILSKGHSSTPRVTGAWLFLFQFFFPRSNFVLATSCGLLN
jgi:hypothetical protein